MQIWDAELLANMLSVKICGLGTLNVIFTQQYVENVIFEIV